MPLEKKLLHAIKSNNKETIDNVFEMIYYEYSKLVAYIISRYVERAEDIEEIVNDVFISFYNASTQKEIKDIKYYLVTSAKNKSIDFYRKKANKLDVCYNEENVFDYVESRDSIYGDLLNEMKKFLTEEEINIIILHLVYNYTFKELSDKYHKPISTVAATYNKALKKFKKGSKKDESK